MSKTARQLLDVEQLKHGDRRSAKTLITPRFGSCAQPIGR